MIRISIALLIGAVLGAGVGWLIWGLPDFRNAWGVIVEAQP